MVEQHTVDELKIVVCIPQTTEVKLADGFISLIPYQNSVSIPAILKYFICSG